MSKKLLKINHDEELTYQVDGYVLGVKGFSILFDKTYSLNEIKKIKEKYNDKKIFVSLNKPIFNDEVKDYKKILLKLDKIALDGIIVGDVASLTYDLKTNLILDQMHLNNCYETINFYLSKKVKGFLLTNDITKDEIDEIRKNTNALLFKQVFGYSHLSTSKRKLISNYFTHFNLQKTKDKKYQIKENNSCKYYKIVEDDFGTHILSDKVLNLLGVNLDVDYEIIDGYLINDIKDVITSFMNNNVLDKEKIDKKYNADTGFINKKTIYKVKDDENK